MFLKLDNVVHNIKDKIAEIRVHVPRHEFFVKTTTKSFEESFDDAFESLLTQIKRKKAKTSSINNSRPPQSGDLFLLSCIIQSKISPFQKILFQNFCISISLTFAFPKNGGSSLLIPFADPSSHESDRLQSEWYC